MQIDDNIIFKINSFLIKYNSGWT